VWLLPIFSFVSRVALGVFYRLTMAGERVPQRGPILLLANHPNSLVDPAMVGAVARRPVRFLAKAPLFTDRALGWLIRGSGSIPVYRRQDDPTATGRNEDMFRAVWEALGSGCAVGMFPEGLSHDEPALAPLKTGAARIALGAAPLVGGAFPVIPVGLSFREKQTFRSDALAVVGEPVRWDDLAAAGVEDRDAVEELTRRIDDALRDVTVNLQRWEDVPLVEAAEAVYAAELPVSGDPGDRVERLREASEGLARLRAEDREEWHRVADAVAAHARVLRVLGLRPEELQAAPRTSGAALWTLRQLLFFLVGAPLAALGIAIYFLPYRLTGIAEARARRGRDSRATFKVMVGAIVHLAWTLAVAALVAWRAGPLAGAAALVALPLVGLVTVHVLERWSHAAGEARRFFLRTRRPEVLEEMRSRQRALAERLHALWQEVRA